MNQADKRLAAMRENPCADWTIDDVKAVCRRHDVSCTPPSGGGSHYTVSHPQQHVILTIPARRPIKPFYIVGLVRFIEAVLRGEA